MMRSLLTQLLPLPLGAAALLLAEVTAVDPSIISMAANGATVVVLVWYVIYDVRTRTPAMLKAFADEQEATRKTFTEEQEETRKTFREEQAELRESYRGLMDSMRVTLNAEQAALRQAFTSEQAAARTHYEKENSELRNMLIETLRGMRTAVHDVRDTANEFILKSAANQTSQ